MQNGINIHVDIRSTPCLCEEMLSVGIAFQKLYARLPLLATPCERSVAAPRLQLCDATGAQIIVHRFEGMEKPRMDLVNDTKGEVDEEEAATTDSNFSSASMWRKMALVRYPTMPPNHTTIWKGMTPPLALPERHGGGLCADRKIAPSWN